MKAFKIRHLAVLTALAIAFAVLLAATPTPALGAVSNPGQVSAEVPGQYNCSYVARYVADVTIPDGTVLAPGASFTKIWRIRNAGTCTWGSAGYLLNSLVFVGGTRMANTGGVPLPAQVGPGQVFEISIPMVAPSQPGRYVSQWKLQYGNGALLGFGSSGQATLYTEVMVSGGGTPAPQICTYYVVRYGDWLKTIAARFGTTWQAIAQANRLYNPNWLYAGQRLAIPCATVPPPGQSGVFTSTLYHYAVTVPDGWAAKVNTSSPGNHEYVSFSAPGSNLPQIQINVQTGQPPFTGFEGCNKNMIFHGWAACSFTVSAGQQPATRMFLFQKGDDYFHIAMLYEDSSSQVIWDTFLTSFHFTD